MAVTYFGRGCDAAGALNVTPAYQNAGTHFIRSKNVTLTCPGSGNQDVVDLSHYCHFSTGSPFIRIMVYSANLATLFAYGTTRVAVVGGGGSWQGHQSQGVITQLAPLVGGTAYRAILATDDTAPNSGCVSGSSGDWAYRLSGTYTTGTPPQPLDADDGDSSLDIILRIGVQPVGAGAINDLELMARGMFRGALRGGR